MDWNRKFGPFAWWWPVAVVTTTGLAVAGLRALGNMAREGGVFQEPEGAWRVGRLALAGVGVLVLLTVLAAVAAVISRGLPPLLNGYVWCLGGLLFLAGVGVAVERNQLSLVAGLTMGLLGVLALVFSFLFLRVATFGEPPLFESHWGGLGGGLGGWRVSASLTYLVAALLFGLLLAGLAFQQVPAAPEESPASEEERGAEDGEGSPEAPAGGESATGEEPEEAEPSTEATAEAPAEGGAGTGS